MMVLFGILIIIIKHFKEWSKWYDMYEDIINQLKQKGIEFARGLSDEELFWIEHEYEIAFPEELKNFYKEALPISKGFYNWRDKRNENIMNIKRVMNMPIQSIIENFEEIEWSDEWGEEPCDMYERKKSIEDMALMAPKLIPIYSHRYMAAIECKKPPIFSICGTDIIYVAKSLKDYFLNEFITKKFNVFMNNEVSYISFWSDLP